MPVAILSGRGGHGAATLASLRRLAGYICQVKSTPHSEELLVYPAKDIAEQAQVKCQWQAHVKYETVRAVKRQQHAHLNRRSPRRHDAMMP